MSVVRLGRRAKVEVDLAAVPREVTDRDSELHGELPARSRAGIPRRGGGRGDGDAPSDVLTIFHKEPELETVVEE